MSNTLVHLSIDGQQSGPHAKGDVRAWLQSGDIPANALCWFDGMKTWQQVTTVFPDVRPPQPVFSGGRSPYGPQKVGLGRLGYVGFAFLIVIGVVLASAVVPTVMIIARKNGVEVPAGAAGLGGRVIGLLALVVLVRGVALRLKNIGWSPWLSLLFLVPVMGQLFGLALVSPPPNFASTRRMDNAAWIILTIAVIVVGLVIVSSVTLLQRLQSLLEGS